MAIISMIVALIFATLALIHFYWAFFGIKNPELVLPVTSMNEKMKLPGTLMTFGVGLGLLFFALVFVNQSIGFLSFDWLFYIQTAIGTIFMVRAIGDFRYVGFFKSVKDTPFAKMDTKFYIPLCLFLSLSIALSIVL